MKTTTRDRLTAAALLVAALLAAAAFALMPVIEQRRAEATQPRRLATELLPYKQYKSNVDALQKQFGSTVVDQAETEGEVTAMYPKDNPDFKFVKDQHPDADIVRGQVFGYPDNEWIVVWRADAGTVRKAGDVMRLNEPNAALHHASPSASVEGAWLSARAEIEGEISPLPTPPPTSAEEAEAKRRHQQDAFMEQRMKAQPMLDVAPLPSPTEEAERKRRYQQTQRDAFIEQRTKEHLMLDAAEEAERERRRQIDRDAIITERMKSQPMLDVKPLPSPTEPPQN